MRSLADRFVCLHWRRVAVCVCVCACNRRRQRVQHFALCFTALDYISIRVCVCLCLLFFFHFCICAAFVLPQCFIRFIYLLFGHSRRSQPGPPPFLQTAAFWTWNFCLFAFSFAFPILGCWLLFSCCCLCRYPATGARSFSLPLVLSRAQLRQLRVSLGLCSFRLLCSVVVVNTKRAGEQESKLSVVVFVRACHVGDFLFLFYLFFGKQEVKAKARIMISITITCYYFNWA